MPGPELADWLQTSPHGLPRRLSMVDAARRVA
jgi:hypothetical protein